MKKHNMGSRIKFGMTSILLILLFAGCKSAPAGRTVDPLELIDAESSFYIAVPRAADNVLIERIVKGFYEKASDSDAKLVADHVNKSDSDAKLVADHVNKIYCGLNRSKNNMDIQAAIDGNIPRKLLPKVLNNKNGWQTSDYIPEGSAAAYKVYSNNIDMSFPSEKIACIGRNTKGMLTRYDTLSKLPPDDPVALYSDLEEELTSYLKGAEDEIRFFANKPQSFLTILTGASLDLKLIDVRGSFKTDPKHQNQYLLTLDFRFRNGTFLKAGKTLLILAFGLTNSQEEIIEENELIIHNIRIDKQQLYKLLSI